jgi:catechol 2,3-dioxygenase-like lactoylglutathione lyase family enzyme
MAAPPLQGFDHVHVFVRDRSAATAWYRDTLGFTVVPEFEGWAPGDGPLTLRDAGDRIHLALFERPSQPNRATIALRADAAGLAAWHAHLSLHLGQPPVVEDHGLSMSIYFSDPDGNPFEIATYEHAAARALVPR